MATHPTPTNATSQANRPASHDIPEFIERLFAHFDGRYPGVWLDLLGDQETRVKHIKRTWAAGLSRFSQQTIAKAIAELPNRERKAMPPNLDEFMAMCMRIEPRRPEYVNNFLPDKRRPPAGAFKNLRDVLAKAAPRVDGDDVPPTA